MRPGDRTIPGLAPADALVAAVLLSTAAVLGLPVLAGGYATYVDNPVHLAEIHSLAGTGRQGWSDIGFCGLPLGRLHSPLWYGLLGWLAGLGVPVGPPYVLLLWLAASAPALAVYRVSRRALSPLPAAIPAVLLVLQRPVYLGLGSVYAGMWTYTLAIGAAILLLDRLARGERGLRDAAAIAVLLALVALTHLFALVACALLIAAHAAWTLVVRRDPGFVRCLLLDAGACATAALASSAYWLPQLLARESSVLVPDNLPLDKLLLRFLLPIDYYGVALSGRLVSDELLYTDALPMLLLVGLGLGGALVRGAGRVPAARYGSLWAGAVFLALVVASLKPDFTWLGPVSWRLQYVVRAGLALASSAWLVRRAGLARARIPRWAAGIVCCLIVLSATWWGQPLRGRVADPGGREMRDLRELWDWLGDHAGEIGGRVYVQDTFMTPPLDSDLVWSHAMALTAHEAGVEQVGPYYGAVPYPTVQWTLGEWGRLAGVRVRDESSLEEALNRLHLANATRVVVVHPGLGRLLEELVGILVLETRIGRFSVLRFEDPEPTWLLAYPGIRATTIERRPGFYRIAVVSDRDGGGLVVKEAMDVWWKVEGPAPVRVSTQPGSLIEVVDLPAGNYEITLRWTAPRFPWILTAIGWLVIAAAWIAGRRRLDRRRRGRLGCSPP